VTECVGFNVHSIHAGHFRDKSFQAIDCTGTDNQITTKKQWRLYDFQFGGQLRGMVFGRGIQLEQLQVSYYELYYANLWF